MTANARILLDACVLANFGVCDLLLRLAERPRLFVPVWTDQILEEIKRTHIVKLKWREEIAESFQREIRKAFPQSFVTGHEPLIASLTNDEKDRHVLAAAIHGGAEILVTFNLRDFPVASLKQWAGAVIHPQDFLLQLYESDAGRVQKSIEEISERRRKTPNDILLQLCKSVPRFADRVLEEYRQL